MSERETDRDGENKLYFMKTVTQTWGLSHTALNVTDITHAHGGGGRGGDSDSKIYQSISMFQLNKQNTELNKQNTVKMVGGGGGGDKGPHKNPTTNNWSGIN